MISIKMDFFVLSPTKNYSIFLKIKKILKRDFFSKKLIV